MTLVHARAILSIEKISLILVVVLVSESKALLWQYHGCYITQWANFTRNRNFELFLVLSTAAPDYLIPLIASLVVLAAILLLILCIRGKWRERRRANRETRLATRTTLKKKRNTTQEKPLTTARTYYNQTSTDSTASSSTTASTRSTELRNFEYNRASLLDSTPSVCSTPQVLSPPLSPKEEGAKDEWRRFRVQRNSTQIEIIV